MYVHCQFRGNWGAGGEGAIGEGEEEVRGFKGRRCQSVKRGGLKYLLGQALPILDCSGQEGSAPVLCPCWDEFELPVVTSAQARGEGGEL